MTTQPYRRRDPWEIPKLLASVAIDYLRWTQMIPMVFAWCIGVAVVFVFVAIAFQGEISGYIERNEDRIEQAVERWWGPINTDSEAKIDTAAVKAFIYKSWAVLALAAYLLALLRNAVFGKPAPISLRRKLVIAGVAAMVCGGLAFVPALFMAPGSDQGMMALIVGLFFYALLLWLISAYSLSVNHVLLKVRDLLFDENRLAS